MPLERAELRLHRLPPNCQAEHSRRRRSWPIDTASGSHWQGRRSAGSNCEYSDTHQHGITTLTASTATNRVDHVLARLLPAELDRLSRH
jgi:hypothetical protein